jgi:hypothetical protein
MSNVNLNISLSGQYRAEIKRGDGTIEELPWFDNLITDLGLNRLGSDGSVQVINYVKVGTGTSTPVVTDTSLNAQVAQVSLNNYTALNKGSPNYESEITITFIFAQGAVVGNITEVGIGWDTGTGLFSRALFKDTNGDPVSITLTAIDQLTLYYKVKVFPNLNDVTGSFIVSGTTYNYTIRPALINNFFNAGHLLNSSNAFKILGTPEARNNSTVLAAITSYPIGTSYAGTAGAQKPYVQNSYYADYSITWSISQGNAPTGLKVFCWQHGTHNTYQMILDNPIIKNNTQVLTLNFRFSWGR